MASRLRELPNALSCKSPLTSSAGTPRDSIFTRTDMRLFAYILGFLILIGGLAWGAIEAGVPQLWVMIGSMILLGIGIITGASRTRYHRSAGDVTVVRDSDDV